ncbi:hypothetical protein HDU84_000814 [Entophlyctis sp. JEL0112]|nr:hypothetical protein HDU84_000814 [Entophlyctis sp. JEL0112]
MDLLPNPGGGGGVASARADCGTQPTAHSQDTPKAQPSLPGRFSPSPLETQTTLDIASTDPSRKWWPPQGEAVETTDSDSLSQESSSFQSFPIVSPNSNKASARTRMWDIPAAPVFHPSEEEWSGSPLKYIESIRAVGEEWGIVKIVPPASWKPGFHINQEEFRFETRIQKLNSIDGMSRTTVNYLDQLELFHDQNGSPFVRVPLIDKNVPLDLWLLKKEVEKRGGLASVTVGRKWSQIAKALGADEKACPSAAHIVRASYAKYIQPYEDFVSANLASKDASLLGQVDDSNKTQNTQKHHLKLFGRMSNNRMMKRIAESNESEGDALILPISSICEKGKSEGILLKCDQCKHRFHGKCLVPSVAKMPQTDWYCALCLKTHGDDFGFEQQGSLQSLAEFQIFADKFKRDYFMEKRKAEGVRTEKDCVYIDESEMEAEFWKLVEEDRFNDGVEVQYGADLHSSIHGSGFPLRKDSDDPYALSGWNLNNLPVLPDSLFCNIRNDISGMMVPWLYVGMAFSAFCWHTEDHYTYSINYNHWGDTKTWYGIPASDAVKFELLMKKKVPELFEINPDLLFHLTTIMSPRLLKENLVKVCSTDQRAGEFVVTFPRAYHAGFNQGLNFAEAVNFALPNWLPYGLSCVDRYIRFHKQPVFSHEELVIATAQRDSSVKTCLWLKSEMDILCDREIAGRNEIRKNYAGDMIEILETKDLTSSSRDVFCEICRAYCFCTSVGLSCSANTTSSNKVVCYRHVAQLWQHCECAQSPRLVVRIRISDCQLMQLKEKVSKIAGYPSDWLKRYESVLLEYRRPPLDKMVALVDEADLLWQDLGYELEESATLKAFVIVAKEWITEAKKLFAGNCKAEDVDSGDRSNLSTSFTACVSLDCLESLLKKADELPFDAPEVSKVLALSKYGRNFQSRIINALSSATIDSEEIKMLIEEVTEGCIIFEDEAGKIAVSAPEFELVGEVGHDCQWIENAEKALTSYPSYGELANIMATGRFGSRNQQCIVSLKDLAGYNSLRKRKADVMLELKRLRASSDRWKSDVGALLKKKSILPEEINDVITNGGKVAVHQETYLKLHDLQKCVKEHTLILRSLVQVEPDMNLPFPNSSEWLLKPSIQAVMASLSQLSNLLKYPVKIVEVDYLELEMQKAAKWAAEGLKLFANNSSQKSFSEVIREIAEDGTDDRMRLLQCMVPPRLSKVAKEGAVSF